MSFRAVILFTPLVAALCGCATRNAVETWSVSFDDLGLRHNELIQGLELDFTNANIVAVNKLPYDWDVQITRVSPIQYVVLHSGHFNNGLTQPAFA